MRKLIVVALLVWVTAVRAEPLPDLAQLKLAAEAGNAVAEFDYGGRIYDQQERFAWLLKSAEQGYAPAQDATATLLSRPYTSDPKKKKSSEREAARWASRAAYQGLASAQGQLSSFYSRGIGVSKDPLKAYMWIHIAVQTSQAEGRLYADMIFKANRDGLIRTTPSETIQLGQRLAQEFRPMRFSGMNPVEADLVFSALNFGSIFKIKNSASAVVNNVRFASGETKDVSVDGSPIRLTCQAIEAKAATFSIAGTAYQAVLQLKH
jgi:hypothetical protein